MSNSVYVNLFSAISEGQVYQDTPQTPLASEGFFEHIRYGNWTGAGYSAGNYGVAFLTFGTTELNYPTITETDALDVTSKWHDTAYNAAQQALLGRLANPQVAAGDAIAEYYSALIDADQEFRMRIQNTLRDSPDNIPDSIWGNTAMALAYHVGFVANPLALSFTANSIIADTNGKFTEVADPELQNLMRKLYAFGRVIDEKVIGADGNQTFLGLQNAILQLDPNADIVAILQHAGHTMSHDS